MCTTPIASNALYTNVVEFFYTRPKVNHIKKEEKSLRDSFLEKFNLRERCYAGILGGSVERN